MIYDVKCYCVDCDSCGKRLESVYTGFSIFIDENQAQEEIEDNFWHTTEDGKHLCPDCQKRILGNVEV
jgi:DNA-directed RNA polymerase subunit N (RpoN/RPB10)